MYDNLLDYLTGFLKCGFFWYTLAGVLLFFLYAVIGHKSTKKSEFISNVLEYIIYF